MTCVHGPSIGIIWLVDNPLASRLQACNPRVQSPILGDLRQCEVILCLIRIGRARGTACKMVLAKECNRTRP